MALVVYPNGTTDNVELPEDSQDADSGEFVRLNMMQELVGGYIEAINIAYDTYTVVLVNEDGLLIGLDPNIVASKAVGKPIVGPALFLTSDEWDATD